MDRQRIRVFVACGTGRPFPRLLRKARALHASERIELFAQRGPGTEEFADLPGAALISRDGFVELLEWADVAICHGGSGALHDAVCAGHKPIVMARLHRYGEHVNDHQLELVGALERRGMLRVIDDSVDICEAVFASPGRQSPRDPLELSRSLTDAVHQAIRSDAHRRVNHFHAVAGPAHRLAQALRRRLRV